MQVEGIVLDEEALVVAVTVIEVVLVTVTIDALAVNEVDGQLNAVTVDADDVHPEPLSVNVEVAALQLGQVSKVLYDAADVDLKVEVNVVVEVDVDSDSMLGDVDELDIMVWTVVVVNSEDDVNKQEHAELIRAVDL